MLASLTFALLAARNADTVAEYFPTKEGTTWLYEEIQVQNGKRLVRKFTNVAEKVRQIAGDTLVPIAVFGQTGPNQEPNKVYTFYQITPTDVFIAGFNESILLEVPYSVLKVSDRKISWKHDGVTDMLGATTPAKFDCTSEPIGAQPVLGNDVATIEVKMKVQMVADGVKVVSDQTSWYAKGIGLTKFESNTQFGKQNYRTTSKLVSYTPGT